MSDPDHTPKYRHYRPKNLAVVRIDGRDIYLGKYNSPESWEKYGRVIAEWRARDVVPTSAGGVATPEAEQDGVTVNELILAFWRHAENDTILLVGLRHGTCHASLGADNDLRYLMGRLRAVWPDVQIHVRGDSGLGVPRMYDVCHQLRLTYTFGIGMDSRLRACSDGLLRQVLEEYERTGQPQRSFLLIEYQAESWPASQPVVIKVEAHAQGTNRRAVVANRPGCRILPPAVYDEYALRGEGENRNRSSRSNCMPAGSATTGSWRTSSGSTCTRPR